MRSPFYHIRHAHKTFEHFHQNLHHAFVIIVLAMIGMLRGASHILTPTHASRQWGGFLTADFWSQNNDQDNIIYALFGNTPGDTAYTRLWTSTCFPDSYITQLNSSTFHGGPLLSNGIYILESGNYNLTQNITLDSCSALIGSGKVVISGNGYSLVINNEDKIILDNISFNSNGPSSIRVTNSSNITLHNIQAINSTSNNPAILLQTNTTSLADSLYTMNNSIGVANINGATIQNSIIYNNSTGLILQDAAINNSQIFNNQLGTHSNNGIYHNTMIYNNITGCQGIVSYPTLLHDVAIYNNTVGISTTYLSVFGTVRISNNSLTDTGSNVVITGTALTTPSSRGSSSSTLLTTPLSMGYTWVSNPQTLLGTRLINGSDLSINKGTNSSFNPGNTRPRYIFGSDIFHQSTPVFYYGSGVNTYGSDTYDYTTTKYIAEPDGLLISDEAALVEYYFGSSSLFDFNRSSSPCSLSAFRIKTLAPSTTSFSGTYHFEDHTLYILTGGEYRSTLSSGNAFVFDGNCTAVIGNENTRFTKGGSNISNLFLLQNNHHIILDTFRVDGKFYGTQSSLGQSRIGISVDSGSSNITLTNLHIYNNLEHGIYLGLGGIHHTAINNVYTFNNGIAGIYFRNAATYNIINNTQSYNNQHYGIWMANGSSKNAINNFQLYNNRIGFFGDLTTTENILNRGSIYNNSEAGISLKNSSNNMFNDLQIFHNATAFAALYNSPGNTYYGDFELLGNRTNELNGTTANDSSLSPGTSGIFAYAGNLVTGSRAMSCQYASNPTLTGNITLLGNQCINTGYKSSFVSPTATDVRYTFGISMQKQTIPVLYVSGGYLDELEYRYDESKFITEMFALRDTSPENIFFPALTGKEFSTWYTSSGYTVDAINTPINASLTMVPNSASGYLIINGVAGGYTGIVEQGDIIAVGIKSATGYNQSITGILTLGTATATGFVVSTRDFDQLPSTGSFGFVNFTSLEPNTFTGSTVAVSGIETGILASIVFLPTTTSGRLEVYSGSTLVSRGTTGLLVYSGNIITAIAQSSSGYGQIVTGSITLGQGTGGFTLTNKGGDTTAPSTPIITYPLTGNYMYYVHAEWTPSIDTGSGIEGYRYEIADDNDFLETTHEGFIATTGSFGSPDTDFDERGGRHYIRIKARDRDGNYSPWSNTGYFRIYPRSDQYFKEITGAHLISYYTSDVVKIQGISTGASLYVSLRGDDAKIYKNNDEKGTGTYVENGDTIFLVMRSSNAYATTRSTELIIGNRSLEFSITTKSLSINGCTLSDDDRDDIQMVFDSLVENYENSGGAYEQFLTTMQSMLEDEISFSNNCNLMYLQDLIGQALGLTQGTSIQTQNHIAPNCKEYQIRYDSTTQYYTSPTFTSSLYFANRDTLTKYIDSKNPGDCHINTYPTSSRIFSNTDASKHIASNGKIYYIVVENGKYTSSNFVAKKYFSSLAALRTYIDQQNPTSQVWNHIVDISFTPQTYTAPNGKSYKIYRTDRGYMSYKLLKVQYFTTLNGLQTYININNQK